MSGGPDTIEVAVDGPARAVFTTRRGGVSGGAWAALNLGADSGDRPEDVRANRELLAARLGVDPAAVTMAHQVHGADVLALDAPSHPGLFGGGLRGWHPADALATTRVDLPVMVLGADCLPVLIWRRDLPGVAAAHAGWRGLVAGVLGSAIAAVGEPGAVGVAIGPGIGPCCYEVSGEVRARFAATFGDGVIHGRTVDLAGSARRALLGAGVPGGAIRTVEACTRCEDRRYFSHRGSGGTCGRQAGIIWATGDGDD
ncbi:MAG: polyphenol oxidase family protein [Thermoleophilia bacterium]